MAGNIWLWVFFNIGVLIMLVLDLAVFQRKNHKVSIRESLTWTFIWIAIALAFNLWLYLSPDFTQEQSEAFLTGYLIEKALSIDNLFVFLMLFRYFKVPDPFQHKVLFYGIVGALVMRAIFIFAGIGLLNRFDWLMYIFGAFLLYTGFKIFVTQDDHGADPYKNPLIRLLRRWFRITPTYHDSKFFVRQGGKLFATPMFLVLVAVETTDVVFALDSIPAILAITRDSFIVYTSNVFAILGLRALYFALSGIMSMFRYLQYGLSFILIFVGIKMLISEWHHINPRISLFVVLGVLTLSIVASLIANKLKGPMKDDSEGDPKMAERLNSTEAETTNQAA